MIQRNFYPGDKWIFFKIYSSPVSANNLLLNRIYPLIRKWLERKVIVTWFFIRYTDPDYHLRIRVELADTVNWGNVVTEMRTILEDEISNEIIHKIQIDTYQRELERYGIDNIIKCECLFQKDSEYVMRVLECGNDEDNLLIEGIDWLYDFLLSVKMSPDEMMCFASEMASRYKLEYDFSSEHVNLINRKYRHMRKIVLEGIKNSYEAHSGRIKDLQWLCREDNNGQLLSSIIHMHFNRLFTINQRVYEYIIYQMLCKTLDSVRKQLG